MKGYIGLILCLVMFIAKAEMVDTFQFNSPEERSRAVALAKSLRCPQCQNQNLVESNSPIAYDLRLEVYRMIDEGKSNEEIIQAMTARFGNFVLYKPPFDWKTALLWLLPVTLLLLALLLMWWHVRRQQSTTERTILDHQQQQALNALLSKTEQRK
ncbi:heme lyase NrfEFG subunit NrfF [Conservatibacter flavescens]|uniref:Formate-dependent nitrite reductase complex subunit n=1 Tax=Conservatibacter flavescens TaxID=28161 RepID=A0A2M8S1W7_9PAST|nr:heme lyase NrfEFG subunit NrfF [Conservatibacter flavescens]PJG85152.1 heme lyase NrfEFG subunit NrfF [Conservatibacter flavescens]